MNRLYFRIILNVLIALSILWMPWWASLALSIFLLVLFRAYEVLVWAFVYDSLYGSSIPAIYGFSYMATLIFVVLFAVVETVKTRLLYS